MAYGVSNGHVTDYDTWSRKAKLDRDPNTLNMQYLENGWKMLFNNNRIITAVIRGSTVGYPSDSVASCIVLASLGDISWEHVSSYLLVQSVSIRRTV